MESSQSARISFGRPLVALRFLTFFVALLSALLYTGAAIAQQPAADGEAEPADGPWWGVVTKDDLIMRCGNSEFYYSVGTLKSGDVVNVDKVNKESGWATIRAPYGTKGFVIAGEFDLSADGAIAASSEPRYGRYPDGEDPLQSFKFFAVKAGTPLHILETVKTSEKDFLLVALPDYVPVSVQVEALRPGSEDEVKAWNNKIKLLKAGKTKDLLKPVAESEDGETKETAALSKATEEDENAEPTEAMPAGNPAGDDHQDQTTSEDKTADTNNAANEGQAITETAADATAPTLEDLEVLYDRLKKTSILDAEIEPILYGFQSIEADPNQSSSNRRTARARIKLLEIRLKNQEARRRLSETLAKAKSTIQEAVLANDRIAATGTGYASVSGRLQFSSIFDGVRLPLRYRLRDLITGRTITYVLPPKENNLVPYLDRDLRIFGRISRDPVLNVSVLKVSRIEPYERNNTSR